MSVLQRSLCWLLFKALHPMGNRSTIGVKSFYSGYPRGNVNPQGGRCANCAQTCTQKCQAAKAKPIGASSSIPAAGEHVQEFNTLWDPFRSRPHTMSICACQRVCGSLQEIMVSNGLAVYCALKGATRSLRWCPAPPAPPPPLFRPTFVHLSKVTPLPQGGRGGRGKVGTVTWRQCPHYPQGAVIPGAQAGLKALYTCTSWYAYATMSGSSTRSLVRYTIIPAGGGGGRMPQSLILCLFLYPAPMYACVCLVPGELSPG